METTVDEIAEGIYRISTFNPQVAVPHGMTFNQFLVVDDEPLLFHTGHRSLFPLVSEAVAKVVPIDRLRWITFGHIEADENGSMNQWLAAAPNSQVAHGVLGCAVSLNDMADRPPRQLAEGEVLELGRHRLRQISTPHVPHAWEAQLLFDETTSTLFTGDLFAQIGICPPLVDGDDIVSPALATEDRFQGTCLLADTAPTIRRLADLQPDTLALMHGPSFRGQGTTMLNGLADAFADRFANSLMTDG